MKRFLMVVPLLLLGMGCAVSPYYQSGVEYQSDSPDDYPYEGSAYPYGYGTGVRSTTYYRYGSGYPAQYYNYQYNQYYDRDRHSRYYRRHYGHGYLGYGRHRDDDDNRGSSRHHRREYSSRHDDSSREHHGHNSHSSRGSSGNSVRTRHRAN